MQRHEIVAALEGLGLKGMVTAFDDAVTNGIRRDRTIMEMLADLLRAETAHRGAASIRYRMNDTQRNALVDVVESGPIPAIHGVVRWRLIDLAQWLYDEFAVSLDETTIIRELKKLGYVKLTARSRHHSQNEHTMEAFKKGFAAELEKVKAILLKGAPIDI